MNQKKVSVHGLQNIGMLLGRADAPKPAPSRERGTVEGIYEKTFEKIIAALPVSATAYVTHAQQKLMEGYLRAGLRDAYNLGHSEALEQNGQVERLLEKQYETRTRVTTPAVVCAVMEQTGLSSMTLDMALMATVFERCDIQYTVSGEDVIEFTMRPIGAFTDGALGTPFVEHPEEIDPTDPRDTLEDDVRHQVEDIEQTTRESGQ